MLRGHRTGFRGASHEYGGSGWYVPEKVRVPHTLPMVRPGEVEKAGQEGTPGRVKARRPVTAPGLAGSMGRK